jgi:hypothetical protein
MKKALYSLVICSVGDVKSHVIIRRPCKLSSPIRRMATDIP